MDNKINVWRHAQCTNLKTSCAVWTTRCGESYSVLASALAELLPKSHVKQRNTSVRQRSLFYVHSSSSLCQNCRFFCGVSYGIETTTHDKCIACVTCPRMTFLLCASQANGFAPATKSLSHVRVSNFHRAALWSIQPRTPSYFERESHHCGVVFRRRSLSVASTMFRAV